MNYEQDEYVFVFRSNGVLVFYHNQYYGFYSTMNEAFEDIFE